MKDIPLDARTRTGARLAGPLLALLLAGCVEENFGLVIEQAQIPTVDPMKGGCIIPGTKTTALLEGELDVALDKPYPYFLFPLVTNQLKDLSGSMVAGRVDVTAFQVRIEPPPGVQVSWSPDCPAQFDEPEFLSMAAGDSRGTQIEVIRPCHAQLFQKLFESGAIGRDCAEPKRFRAIVKAKGRHGGTSIVSGPFEFPIVVGWGCMQEGFQMPEYAGYNAERIPQCTSLAANPYQGNACNPGQDGLILCCALDATVMKIECPAIARAPK